MIVIGADAHKRNHTFVAVDEVGRRLGEKRVDATPDGHLAALRWARIQFGNDLVWGVEDCRQVSARLQADLRGAGQRVVRVPPRLTARVRASARTRGKSDPIDALAAARVVLREPDLPTECPDPTARELKLLVDRREDLIGQRSATINRLLGGCTNSIPSASPPGPPWTPRSAALS
jgi:transposase